MLCDLYLDYYKSLLLPNQINQFLIPASLNIACSVPFFNSLLWIGTIIVLFVLGLNIFLCDPFCETSIKPTSFKSFIISRGFIGISLASFRKLCNLRINYNTYKYVCQDLSSFKSKPHHTKPTYSAVCWYMTKFVMSGVKSGMVRKIKDAFLEMKSQLFKDDKISFSKIL